MRTWTSTVSPMSNFGTDGFMLLSSTTLNKRFCIVLSFPGTVGFPATFEDFRSRWFGQTGVSGGQGSPLLPAPAGDGGMVAACKHIGDLPAPEHPGTRVLRVFEATLGPERFIDSASRISQDAGHQPDNGVDHDHGRDFPPGEDEVADREQLWLEDLDDPLVESLVPAAKQDQTRLSGQIDNPALIESGSLRREDNQGARGFDPGSHGLGRGHDRGSHEDHARPSPKRPVVHLLVFAWSPVAQVPPLDGHQVLVDRSPDDTLTQEAVEEGWKKSQHIDAERRQGHGGPLPLRRAAGPPRAPGLPPRAPGLPPRAPGLPPRAPGLPPRAPGLPPARAIARARP